jgi:predicted small metal-binding protein
LLPLSVVDWTVAVARFADLSPSFRSLCSAYDAGMKQIPCVCGRVVKGEDDEELWQKAQEHIREDHPDLVDKVSRDDLLAQAEEVP